MDLYGLPAPEYFPVDDLLDFTYNNEDDDEVITTTATSITTTTTGMDYNRTFSPPQHFSSPVNTVSAPHSTDSTDVLSIPCDDVAELEWLSNFVDDSFSDYPSPEQQQLHYRNLQSEPDSSTGRVKSKRPKQKCSLLESAATTWPMRSDERYGGDGEEVVRRCTHCSSEKTPQWRTGPLGPKTLCNACGVRFKSGRLVPEYRPAASPTFVFAQHSNSHRKVMELRRQKETTSIHEHHHHHHHHQHQQQLQQEEEQHNQRRQQLYHHHHQHHHHQVC